MYYRQSAACCLQAWGRAYTQGIGDYGKGCNLVDVLSLKQEEGKHLQFLATREQADPDKLLLCSSFKFS